ncbi:MAG: protein kinase domain-containing protein [Planctomycetota bacterium]
MSDFLDRLAAALSDRYIIERELGAGGMAIVYLAEDLKHRRKVAVKVLRPELAATLGPERFVREIEIAARLAHPHILPLHDSGEADGFLYYVMPFIEGESLRERLDREGKLSVEDCIRITDHVASALNYAHERGVVHRDVKPENVLLAGDQAIVADFGIARAVEVAGGERLTGTGLAIGTPAYMSPEQAVGQQDVDARSDVYALGCVVYEMVGGRAPFDGTTPQALLAKHAADTVPGLRASDPAIPVFVERAVEKALAKRPEDRFQSPSTFAEALTSGTVVARLGPARWPRRAVAGAAAVVLLAVAGWWLAAGGSGIERLAVLPFTNLMNDPAQEYFVEGMHDALVSELAQAGVAVIARTSVMRYRDSEQPVREIARELNVDAVIEASVFRAGDTVGIRAQLVDGGTEESVWAATYERDLANVLALHREVTRAIVDEIQLALTPRAEARLASARPVNPEAYEAYLKGRERWYRLTPLEIGIAQDYFELAIELDSNYALAYVGLADALGLPGHAGWVPAPDVFPAAKAAVAKALELDEGLAEAHDFLARTKFAYDWDWLGAEEEFQRAFELNPNHPDAHVVYAQLLRITGRGDAALAEVQRALDVDPHNAFFQQQFAVQLLAEGRYDDAIEQLQELLKAQPGFPFAHDALWTAMYKKRRYEEALNHAITFLGDPEVGEALTRGYQESGYAGGMRRAAETLAARSQQRYVAPVLIARFYAHAVETDLVLEWLERAIDVHDTQIVYTPIARDFDELWDHPRFREVMRRVNLPASDNTDPG